MTQLAFGRSGGFIDGTAGDVANNVLGGIQKGIDAIGLLNQVPWIMTLLTTFAFLPGPMRIFNDWSNQALQQRKKVSPILPITGLKLPHNTEIFLGKVLLFTRMKILTSFSAALKRRIQILWNIC